MAALAGATALGQGLIVLSSPLLTRLYSPAEFGFFMVFQALVGIFGPVMALRYEFAVPVCRDDREAAATVLAGGACVVAAAVPVGLLLLFGGERLLEALDSLILLPWLWLLWAGLVLMGIQLSLVFWGYRKGAFSLNSRSLIGQFGSQAVFQLAFGFMGLGVFGLVLGYVLSYAVRLVVLVWGTPAHEWRQLRAIERGEVFKAAAVHWRYPAFSTFSTLFQNASQLLPAVLLAPLYGPAVTGWFGLGQRMLTVPTRMIGQAANQVLVAEVRHRNPLGLQRLFGRVTIGFFLLALVGGLPLLFLAPSLFALVFGEEWRTAGTMVQVLIPLHMTRFVIVPVSQTLNVLNLHHLDLLISVLITLALAGAFAAGGLLDLPVLTTIGLYSGSGALIYLFGLFVIWQSVRTHAIKYQTTLE